MIKKYNDLLQICKTLQLKHSRGYAILGRMQNTLEIMKQKKKSLLNPQSKTNSI